MHGEVDNIIFSQFVNQLIPFELITIEELYRRCKESSYDLSVAHRIAFHALIIITKGEGAHTVDFKEEILSPGVILPLAKNQIHSFNKNLTVKGYVISFEESFITQNISEKNLFHFLHVYHTPRIIIEREDFADLIPYLNLLKKMHLDSNVLMKSEIINTTFMAFLFQIKRLSKYDKKTLDSKRFKDFILFKQMITQFYNESHNVNEYAKKLSVSYKYLNDVCKQIGNNTAKAFLDDWLLLEAKRSLSENKFTSKEIAYKMGFNEPSNFIRFFKRHTKITPSQFQKKN